MSHGINTQPSFFAHELVNPRPKSLFQQRMIDKKEGLYATHVRAPLGCSHNQEIGLPKGLDKYGFTFGIPTELGKNVSHHFFTFHIEGAKINADNYYIKQFEKETKMFLIMSYKQDTFTLYSGIVVTHEH